MSIRSSVVKDLDPFIEIGGFILARKAAERRPAGARIKSGASTRHRMARSLPSW